MTGYQMINFDKAGDTARPVARFGDDGTPWVAALPDELYMGLRAANDIERVFGVLVPIDATGPQLRQAVAKRRDSLNAFADKLREQTTTHMRRFNAKERVVPIEKIAEALAADNIFPRPIIDMVLEGMTYRRRDGNLYVTTEQARWGTDESEQR